MGDGEFTMSTSQAKRTALHHESREKLTVDTADTLMDHLPPGGWSDVATKADVELSQAATQRDIAQLRSDFAVSFAGVDTEFAKLRAEIEKGFKNQTRWSAGYMATLSIALIVAFVR